MSGRDNELVAGVEGVLPGETDEEKKIFRFERIDVVSAMAKAGTINASILIMADARKNI